MTLEELRMEFESRFTVHPVCGDRSLSPTGEEYTELMSGCLKDIHNPLSLAPLYRSEVSCIEALLDTLTKYASDKSGVLYWRTPPEIDENVYKLVAADEWMPKELKVWRGYARLLISDKPVVAAAA